MCTGAQDTCLVHATPTINMHIHQCMHAYQVPDGAATTLPWKLLRTIQESCNVIPFDRKETHEVNHDDALAEPNIHCRACWLNPACWFEPVRAWLHCRACCAMESRSLSPHTTPEPSNPLVFFHSFPSFLYKKDIEFLLYKKTSKFTPMMQSRLCCHTSTIKSLTNSSCSQQTREFEIVLKSWHTRVFSIRYCSPSQL